MNKFWIPYISILISGTVAIYYYAPKCSATIMPFVPNWMKPQDPAWVLTTILTNIVSETVLPNESVQKIPLPQKEVLPEDKSLFHLRWRAFTTHVQPNNLAGASPLKRSPITIRKGVI